MPTLNKLEYLDETKQQIKTALNTNFNSGITDEDTFRSYVSKISDIYTNWPKVEGEDTTLNLSPTKKGLMTLDLKGNTSQEGTPTPETPQDIHVVSGDNSINVCGKNLFNKNNATILNAYVDNIEIGTSAKAKTTYIKCQPNTTYTVSKNNSGNTNRFGIATTTTTPAINVSIMQYISNNDASSLTITTNSTAQYLVVQFYRTGETQITLQEMLDSIQIEKGSQATEYEEYNGNTYPINLGTMELCKIGDYQDYIYKSDDKWYKHREIGKVVLNGSEDYRKSNNYSSETYFCGWIDKAIIDSKATANWYNNKFQKGMYTDVLDKECMFIPSNQLHVRILASRLNENSANGFKQWLATQYQNNNPVIAYYVLATPTNTEITDTTLISQLEAIESAMSYDTQTNITQTNDDLPFIISASALMKGGN